MSQIFNSTFQINWGSSRTTSDKDEIITLEPEKTTSSVMHTLHELYATIGKDGIYPNQKGPWWPTLTNINDYNVALLDCQWEKWITGIESFVFNSVGDYPPLPAMLPDKPGYERHFLDYLLKVQEIYEKTGDGYWLSRLFDQIRIGWPGGGDDAYYWGAYGRDFDDPNNTYYRKLGLADWHIQGSEFGFKRNQALKYEGVEVPETLFFQPTVLPGDYNSNTDGKDNIYRPGGEVTLREGLHFIIPNVSDGQLSFTLLVMPHFFSSFKWEPNVNKDLTESFTIDVMSFQFKYKIFNNRVIALKEVELNRHFYTHPVPYQIWRGEVTYHPAFAKPAEYVYQIQSELPVTFKFRHRVHVKTAKWTSLHSINVLDEITSLEQLEYYGVEELQLDKENKQIYINTVGRERSSPFRNRGRVATQYTLNDQENRTLTISPSIKQIEKLVLRPNDTGLATIFSLGTDTNINIGSPKLFIAKIILNGPLIIAEDK